jgi:surface antigen
MPVGSFWGNATTWDDYARGSGYLVNNSPSVGAVLQSDWQAGGYGHVAVVESVNVDGSITVSEMNYAGWNVKSYRTISPSEAASYKYIH